MKRRLTTAAASLLVMGLVGCGSSGDSMEEADATERYDASTATAEEKWTYFEELATEAGVEPKNYPATFEESEQAATALCSRTAKDVAAIDALMTATVGEKQYELEKEAEFFFLEAYCPEKVAVFEEGHELPPPKPKG